jgi:hypothetical protein
MADSFQIFRGPLILIRVYTCLNDFAATEREAATALAAPEVAESVKRAVDLRLL